MKKTSLVIDGNYLMFQSFYATYRGDLETILRSSKGVPTNAISIFMSQLIKLIYFIDPDCLFIAFDAKEKTSRHLEYSEYKSGRTKAPNELFIQFDLIKELLTKLNITWMEKSGYEADDLIATYTKVIPGEKYIFSRDKDLLQLVNEEVSIVEKTSYGYEILDNDNFYDKYSFYPNQVVSYKGLKGDPSDNLPGIKGIGDVTAIKLLKSFGTFENIYANLDSKEITASVRKKLIEGQKDGYMCYKLAQLVYDVPDFPTKEIDFLINVDYSNAKDLIDELELKKLWSYLKELHNHLF
ncbi:5'-3' exonuclease [Mycoplasmopsis glycophila]|uniref:5'-3' exonuclease n=1 Tax=Mycoplasmopsis glycophila TaxID=171285 RepID=A0A449AW92_9BACT|nr:5'-3' exonuclease H3TH domain-containing protein [Mycoplasmopsis glycophila]VEU70913.1 Putative DNA polymerase I [Mycoplasmopsis glycophila]